MFERFTDRARRAVVLAEEEARGLNHTYVGTEHLLLGLLALGEGVAFDVLRSADVSLREVRASIVATVGLGKRVPSGHIPFTPHAKHALEHALREAMRLGVTYLGTEHILLGLLAEPDSVAARMLADEDVSLQRARGAVRDVLAGMGVGDAPSLPEIQWRLTGALDRLDGIQEELRSIRDELRSLRTILTPIEEAAEADAAGDDGQLSDDA